MAPELGLSQTLSGHTGQVWDVAWNPQGNILASCGEDKTIRIWSKEAEKWACRAILADGHQRTIRSVAWSPCGSMLASASFDATCCIWDKKSGQWECTATLEGHENEVKSVAWSPSGQFLATCSRDKSVWVWEVDEDGEFECAAVLNAHTQDVKRVIWHPTLDIIASASYDNSIKLFKQDDDDWICFDTLSGHESTVWSLAFNADGSELASCSDDRSLKIWKETSGSKNAKQDLTYRCIASLTGFHTRAVYDVDWSHLTDFIATSSGDDAIRIFIRCGENPENFDLVLHVPRAHDQDVNAVAWNPAVESILASTSDDGTVKIWHFKP